MINNRLHHIFDMVTRKGLRSIFIVIAYISLLFTTVVILLQFKMFNKYFVRNKNKTIVNHINRINGEFVDVPWTSTIGNNARLFTPEENMNPVLNKLFKLREDMRTTIMDLDDHGLNYVHNRIKQLKEIMNMEELSLKNDDLTIYLAQIKDAGYYVRQMSFSSDPSMLSRIDLIKLRIVKEGREKKLAELKKDLRDLEHSFDKVNKNDYTEKFKHIIESIEIKERELKLAELRMNKENAKVEFNKIININIKNQKKHDEIIYEIEFLIKTETGKLRLAMLNKLLSDFRNTVGSTIVNTRIPINQPKTIKFLTNCIDILKSQNYISELRYKLLKVEINIESANTFDYQSEQVTIKKQLNELISIEDGNLNILLLKQEFAEVLHKIKYKYQQNDDNYYDKILEQTFENIQSSINVKEIQNKILVLQNKLAYVNSYIDKDNTDLKYKKQQNENIKQLTKSIKIEQDLLSTLNNKIETGNRNRIFDNSVKDIEQQWVGSVYAFSKQAIIRHTKLVDNARNIHKLNLKLIEIKNSKLAHTTEIEIKKWNKQKESLEKQIKTLKIEVDDIKNEAVDNKQKYSELIVKIQSNLLEKENVFAENKKLKTKNKKKFEDDVKELNDRITVLEVHIKEEKLLINYKMH